jgi:3-deoxy-manno-octulosonate cytidylyltransferase (CMP-KDO synthetase)
MTQRDCQRPRVVAILPARMGSSRFPGKPLVSILGLPMIEHVRRRAMLCGGVDDVYVATCDEPIRSLVAGYGGKVIMTARTHERCTDRIEEAARGLDCDVVVNVQGDEPALLPEVLEAVIKPLIDPAAIVETTCVVYPMTDPSDAENANVVKTVLSRTGSILYLSRSAIPSNLRGRAPCYKQSGIMAFSKSFLHVFAGLSPTPLEAAESVDMLRVLEHDYRIGGVIFEQETRDVDVPADVQDLERFIMGDARQCALYEQIRRSAAL